ncbi:hypothetical protein GCM10025868_17920 [Angustibacter aerolatus]|uniref:Response regulatory domain-containing protein n=1 Tax=Angustibacter aerolatus TaxID=1162965 RepID=A0ABQ6JFH2_9ACTN|nr:hypothetical protein GCM10025868_17920 [Angustibacter aerolatus]
MISVLVVDDQAMVRQGFAALLAAQDGIEVLGDAANGAEAVRAVQRRTPDVVLMDVRMPEMDGIEAIRRIMALPLAVHPKVLVLTTFDLDDYVYEALRAGASGFLLKDARAEEPGAGGARRGRRRRPARPDGDPAADRRARPAPGRRHGATGGAADADAP